MQTASYRFHSMEFMSKEIGSLLLEIVCNET